MAWIKRTIRIAVWEDGTFTITEDGSADKPFRLDSPFGRAEYFSTLDDAKATAKIQNELWLTKQENERLRAELSEYRQPGKWPDDDQDDGRGVPAIAAELVEVMAANGRIARNGAR